MAQQDFRDYRNDYDEIPQRRSSEQTISFINRVYGWMCGGLVLTALAAMLVASNPAWIRSVTSRGTFLVLILVELGLVMAISWGINKMSATAASLAFIAYSAVNGVTLSVIFLAYTMESLAGTFLITAGTFGAMALYGHYTKRDLTSFGNLFFMALIGLIIASVVNLFLKSTALMWIVSYLGVLIFMGLTAYDSQKLKEMSAGMDGSSDGETVQKYAILGALALYLDFINLFLFFLRIFGGRRD